MPTGSTFRTAYGEFDVFVPERLERPILISFETTLGPSARLSASGHYTIIAPGRRCRLSTMRARRC